MGGKTSKKKIEEENVTRQTFTETKISHKISNAVVVAAIDFGTTNIGYGFSFKVKPGVVYTNYRGINRLVFDKTPTVVLMHPNKKFHSFGIEAKHKYSELMDKDEHRDWYFFERFKMKLFARETPLVIDMEIEDILGKPMVAIDVFSAAINHIREQLHATVSELEKGPDTEIHWVLTVPAIWDDLSKQFMREAAKRAGIPSDMLTLALEPEAASLFCKEDLMLGKEHFRRYMLVDIGGGTADIVCHEVSSDGTLKELHPPTGGAFGGTSVDNAFLDVLNRIFGSDIIHSLKKTNLKLYWEIFSNFEVKKSHFKGSGRIVFKFPLVLLQHYETMVGESVHQTMKQSSFARTVNFKADKMSITEILLKDFFDTAVIKVKDAIVELLEKVENINCIILVGGFAGSPYLQKVMKEHFGNLILLPGEPSLAVLKGACIYGHDPKAISSRKCKYTYGIARMERFDPRIHPEEKKVRMGDFTYCDDRFCKHIEFGTEVSVDRPDEATVHKYYPSFADQRHAALEVYCSTEKDPIFVDDKSCKFVGLIKIEIDTRGNIWTKLMVRLIFGGTELIVEVKDVNNQIITRGSVDFLG